MGRFCPQFLLLVTVATPGESVARKANTTLNSQCSWGYTINATTSPTHVVFTEVLETDFTHFDDMQSNAYWAPQLYNQTSSAARETYGKQATLQNVIPNPYTSGEEWSGSGIHGGDAGLQLWVNSTPVDGMIAMGEIASKRADMLYGSFRVGMKVTGTPGTCGAFFYYHNDSQEIDVEFLSSSFNASSNPINLIMQTPESVSAGYNAAGTSTYKVQQLPFVPYDSFHEYRFDWTPDKVSFYVDSQWLQDLYYVYPQASGHISLNHWSNGNTAWSKGPPSSNAVITISYIKAYFNSSDPQIQQQHETECATPAQAANTCLVQDQMVSGTNGFGKTNFYNWGMCGEKDSTDSITTTSTTASVTSTSAAKSVSSTLISASSTFHIEWSADGYNLLLITIMVIAGAYLMR